MFFQIQNLKHPYGKQFLAPGVKQDSALVTHEQDAGIVVGRGGVNLFLS